MRSLNRNLLCAGLCAFALCFPADIVVLAQQAQSGPQSTPANQASNDLSASAELPDSPGATQSQAQSQTAPPPQSNAQNNSTSDQTQDPKMQRPVGTAAAEAPKVSGITAAQPAGIAIAPGKQKHARALVIKVGAIVGGAAALGAVIALSRATPSKPPGAH
jgi:cytoskeletal protein RodZ